MKRQKTTLLLGISKISLAIVTSLLILGFIDTPRFPHLVEYGRIAAVNDSPAVPATGESDVLPWHLEKIQAVRAWQESGIGQDVIVAVLDTGIDEDHEDLQDRVIDRVNLSPSKTTDDVNGHGTVIAGIITASIADMKGATGVAYRSSLLNVKVAGDDGFVNPEALAKGIIWAADHQAGVINISITLSKSFPAVEAAVKYAWGKGCVIVAAAGNAGGTKLVYPAAYSNVIGVAATDQNDNVTKWSNHGDWVAVSAPGTEILSTSPDDKYIYKNGTSFAVPMVAGEAALLYTLAEDINGNGQINDEVLAAICNGTDGGIKGINTGRINLAKAIDALP